MLEESANNAAQDPNIMLNQVDVIVDAMLKETDDPRVQLSGLDREISKVEQLLSKLKRMQPSLRRSVNRAYCPIQQRLPPEIISEVFLCCIPNLGTLKPIVDLETKCSPLFLGSICSAWRHIAWATPKLWTSPSLLLSSKKIQAQGELLEQWISRSGGLPLTLRVHCSADDDRHWADIPPSTVFGIIIQHAKRWRDIDLQVPTFCYATLSAPEGGFSSLRSLVINPTGGQGDRAHKLDWTDYTPQLTEISLLSVYLSTVILRWDNITHIHVRAFYVDECLELMRRAPSVEYCNFHTIIRGEDNHGVPSEPVLLPRLHTLLLVTERVVDAGQILAKISAPALKTLKYDVAERTFNCPQFCGFIKRSACNIETISIIRCAISEAEIIETMTLMPSVVDLKLTIFEDEDHCLGSTLLPLLTPTSSVSTNDVCLLPNLRNLEYAGPSPSDWSLWLQFLRARRGLHDTEAVPVEDDGSLRYGSRRVALLRSAAFNLDESITDLQLSMPASLITDLRRITAHGLALKFFAGADLMEEDAPSEEDVAVPSDAP